MTCTPEPASLADTLWILFAVGGVVTGMVQALFLDNDPTEPVFWTRVALWPLVVLLVLLRGVRQL